MGFCCGIVGLPNVGKSTLFNALTETASAQAANYPFCTIEPNKGRVAVPDKRLDKLTKIGKSQQEIPTSLEFVDIAGLVKGASKGEGLGNQFLANIREMDAIIHVLRCFENDDITHVEGSIDPLRDRDIIDTELMLADMESLEKRLPNMQKRAKGKDSEAKMLVDIMEVVLDKLQNGHPTRAVELSEEQKPLFKSLQLLTAKPVLYVCNVEEKSVVNGNALSHKVAQKAQQEGNGVVVVSAEIESELVALPQEERADFLNDLGLEQSGLDRVIEAGYRLLDLCTYFTVGPKEARAWTIKKGTKAPQAAAVIHNDFERGFIACETISYDDYVKYEGEAGARDAGRLRSEGKNYVVQDGDILLFRFNV